MGEAMGASQRPTSSSSCLKAGTGATPAKRARALMKRGTGFPTRSATDWKVRAPLFNQLYEALLHLARNVLRHSEPTKRLSLRFLW